jgi:hypothetical protein
MRFARQGASVSSSLPVPASSLVAALNYLTLKSIIMTNFEKVYIGKGKLNEQFDSIIAVTIAIDKAEAHIFEYEGNKYLKFEVAARREADQFGNTHAVYVSKKVVTEQPESAPKRSRRKKAA